jgi:hypothetical protein
MTVGRDPHSSAAITPGSYWRHTALGSDAIYRVVDVSGEHVTVAVCEAPGLQAGMEFRLTRAAVAAMTPVAHP